MTIFVTESVVVVERPANHKEALNHTHLDSLFYDIWDSNLNIEHHACSLR